MQHNHPHRRNMEHHPRISIGLFFILLGIALLIATNDILNMGSVRNYFTWQTAMIFIGVFLFINLQFTGGIILMAAGIWFLQDQIFVFTPDTFRTFYWPGVVILIGTSFILTSVFKRKNKN